MKFGDQDLKSLLVVATLCNDGDISISSENGEKPKNGSPTENALLSLAWQEGLDVRKLLSRFERLKVLYRNEGRNIMTTFHQDKRKKKPFTSVKGSPVEVLSRCHFYQENGMVRPLTNKVKEKILAENDIMCQPKRRLLFTVW